MSARARAVALLAAVAAVVGMVAPAAAAAGSSPPAAGTGASLQIYYTPPVIAVAGERVRIPVDAVCATPSGQPCAAKVFIVVRGPDGVAQTAAAPASAGLTFDLTRAARRAAAARPAGGRVSFFIRAVAGGASARMPDAGWVAFYVVGEMPSADLPAIPFGDFRPGETVLTLPWGSGADRAGLSLGAEAPALGPSAFDVDAAGRVFLLDSIQGRIAVFRSGRLAADRRVAGPVLGDMAVGPDGTAQVIGRRPGSEVVTVTRVAPGPDAQTSMGPGIPSQVRVAGGHVFAHILPADAWFRVGRPSDPVVGMPLAGGRRLLDVVRGNALRLAIVSGSDVTDPLELRSKLDLAEVALAQPMGDGYLAVLHVMRAGPSPADQYEVVRAAPSGRILDAFAVPNEEFALMGALSKFRLGADGNLYQMLTSPRGVRIVRYRIGGTS